MLRKTKQWYKAIATTPNKELYVPILFSEGTLQSSE